MWVLLVIMLVSLAAGLVLGPLLARAAADQTAEPKPVRRPFPRWSRFERTPRAPVNRINAPTADLHDTARRN